MDQAMTTVRRPKPKNDTAIVPQKKNGKNLSSAVDMTASRNENKIQKESEGLTEKIGRAAKNIKESIMGNENKTQEQLKLQENLNNQQKKIDQATKDMTKNMEKMKQNIKQNITQNIQKPILSWAQSYRQAESDIKKSLKTSNGDLNFQLQKVYEGMLNNCLKKNQDEPYKLQKCWDQFSTKMKPIYSKLQERSAQSADTLKKCFDSKRNAQDCIQQGIKFGQQTLKDATNSLKAYMV